MAALWTTGRARLSDRLRFFTRPAALPLVLLLLAMATVFLLGNDRGHFYRDGHHDWNSSQSLTFAENLSFQHGLLVFHYQSLDQDGNRYYPILYNRFPKGGYALITLAILPFGDNLAAKIYAARVLMLLLFAAAAALARLTGNGWVALAATALAFSSYYFLYYSDKISNEVTIDLFAVMLAFHGMVVFAQEGRFRQLLVKTVLALLLGWHVYAFLLPFIVFGLASQLIQSRPLSSTSPLLCQLKRGATALLSSRYVRLGVVALLVGIAILAFNFAGEYFALDREKPLTELPSVHSATKRLGADADFNVRYAENLAWGEFLLKNQIYRIGQMLYPFFLSPFDDPGKVDKARDYLAVYAGALALAVCWVGLVFAPVKHKMLLATLVISGFVWALPLRHSVTFHDFETIFYVGIPLVFFTLILLYLRKLGNRQVIAAIAVAALLLFVLSGAEMAHVGHDAGAATAEAEMLQDLKVIRDIVGEGVVYIPSHHIDSQYGGAPWASSFGLAGSVIVYAGDKRGAGREAADFVIELRRDAGPALLTPDNRRIFLYDRALYDDPYDDKALGSPVIASDWNVYLKDNVLIYISEPCANTDARFFLHIDPLDANDLPEHRQQYDFDNLGFRFADFGRLRGQKCVAVRELPEYGISAIQTGQYTAEGPIWEGEHHFELGSPVIASDWNVYLKDNVLIYISEPCANTDARFFLHIDPLDANDLPEHRQQYDFDNLGFRFADFGRLRGQKCVAVRELPEYGISAIQTGQYTAEGPIWEGEYHFER